MLFPFTFITFMLLFTTVTGGLGGVVVTVLPSNLFVDPPIFPFRLFPYVDSHPRPRLLQIFRSVLPVVVYYILRLPRVYTVRTCATPPRAYTPLPHYRRLLYILFLGDLLGVVRCCYLFSIPFPRTFPHLLHDPCISSPRYSFSFHC